MSCPDFFDPVMPNGLSNNNLLNRSISKFRGATYIHWLTNHFNLKFMSANSLDQDQMQQFAVSDLGLHFLPKSQT